MGKYNERIVLCVGPEDVDNAIELQELSDFFNNKPEVKEAALECAYERLTRYIHHSNFFFDTVMEAVWDTAELHGYKENAK